MHVSDSACTQFHDTCPSSTVTKHLCCSQTPNGFIRNKNLGSRHLQVVSNTSRANISLPLHCTSNPNSGRTGIYKQEPPFPPPPPVATSQPPINPTKIPTRIPAPRTAAAHITHIVEDLDFLFFDSGDLVRGERCVF
ncbi:uncharacterized protein LY89DRAFT_346175 [Mollisia scopiformis]|uniref:Uncharacterized protein n=1 Tax=Mollisia scopiformis TaxID=149040 RepID=A0A132B6E2_MOLSC|nr:uncharacterized protein LY89DRAFT_346175 [Mollisia scopiformis]KUJ07972.1 hypothetical protein LY89DRAFT_346175 [Mollisia scopiformis]